MKDWVFRNWTAKLVSLILAVGLWYYAVGEEGIEVTRTVPVEVKLANEKMSIVGKPTRVVVATLQAPRSLLSNLASEELKAEHVIKKVETPGDYSFRLEPQEIRLPSEKIRVLRIDPEVIQVKVDEIIVKKLEIEPVFLGDPAFGYRADTAKAQLDPRSVLVEGPKSQLEKVEKIKTQPIDMVGRARSFRKTVRVAEVPGLKMVSEALIDAYVPIEESVGEKTLASIPLKILGAPDSSGKISLDPAALSLVLRGIPKNLEPLQDKDITAYIEISELSEGIHELTPRILLPDGVTLKDSVVPVRVTVHRKA